MKKGFLYLLLEIVCAAVLGWLMCWVCNGLKKEYQEIKTEVKTFIDTIPYYIPVARDSIVVRYVTERLPVAPDTNVVSKTVGEEVIFPTKADSVEVVIPITQKEYQDSTYHAWVSGYHVNLDSIHTFTRTTITTITHPPSKPKRWHLGVSAGYGMTPHGAEPYIGVGLTYSLISF